MVSVNGGETAFRYD